jgi:hypothetical protein
MAAHGKGVSTWEDIIAAWSLAEAGRWAPALELIEDDRGLAAILRYRRHLALPDIGALPILQAWEAYRRADYRRALAGFMEVSSRAPSGWLAAWTTLGVAKVASDCGWWQAALEWCAAVWIAAESREHHDLLAHAAGARGEILLRAGHPGSAAAAFGEDAALLTSGSRYKGRIRCCQAHAWSRMGPTGRRAAEAAYRLARHSSGESSTRDHVAAGLALLGARAGEQSLVDEALDTGGSGISRFWVLVAAARLARDAPTQADWIRQAEQALPEVHHAERWWFAGWTRALGLSSPEPPDLRDHFPQPFPRPNLRAPTMVELPIGTEDIDDAPWWQQKSPESAEEWWLHRDCFMP